ncbi:MAG: hypothetical protein GY906_30790 [bacterium]|nr:hypothetical protein [bacterium]
MRHQLRFGADNPQYPPIVVEPEDDFEIHGVFIAILHRDLSTMRYL